MSTAQLEDKVLWPAFAENIRERDIERWGVCWCGCGREINCAMHVIPRKKRGVKYHEENVLGGNSWCNNKDRPGFGNHDEFIAKFIDRFGHEKYMELGRLANPKDENGRPAPVKRTRPDIMQKIWKYRLFVPDKYMHIIIESEQFA